MSEKHKVELCHWAVAFVDLLGQGEQMKTVSDLLSTGEEEKAIAGMKEIYFSHKDLYEQFHKTYEAFQPSAPSRPLPPGLDLKDYQHAVRSQLQVQQFSDALMFYVPLRVDDKNLPLNGISTMLSTVGIQLGAFLAKGRPFRCGIDIGFGVEISSGELCGPAVMNAHELESKVAQYPRIVIGKEVIDYIREACAVEPNAESTLDQRVTFSLAQRLMKIFIKDIDGQVILHYLGKEFLTELPPESTMHAMQAAYEFAMSEQEKYRKDKNSKLAFRYSHLCNYFAAHEANWHPDKSNDSPGG